MWVWFFAMVEGFIRLPATIWAMENDAQALLIARLQKQIKVLQSDLKFAQDKALTSQAMRDLIHQVTNTKFESSPYWLAPSTESKSVTGIPCLFLSDIHFDEVVFPDQINGVNQFNRKIAIRRIKQVFQNALRILVDYLNKPN